MLRKYIYGGFPKNYRIIAEERFYYRLHNNDIINSLWTKRGIEIYEAFHGQYIVEPYMVMAGIEWYYSEYVDGYPTRKDINDIVDRFVDSIVEDENYYLSLQLGLPIQVK